MEERGAKRGRGKIASGRIRWKSHFHALLALSPSLLSPYKSPLEPGYNILRFSINVHTFSIQFSYINGVIL